MIPQNPLTSQTFETKHKEKLTIWPKKKPDDEFFLSADAPTFSFLSQNAIPEHCASILVTESDVEDTLAHLERVAHGRLLRLEIVFKHLSGFERLGHVNRDRCSRMNS